MAHCLKYNQLLLRSLEPSFWSYLKILMLHFVSFFWTCISLSVCGQLDNNANIHDSL